MLIASLLSVFDYLVMPSWSLHRMVFFFLGFSAVLIVPYLWRTRRRHDLSPGTLIVGAALVAALFGLMNFIVLGWSALTSALVFFAVFVAELVGGTLRVRARRRSESRR